MLKIHLACPHHPRYNPARHHEAGIRGGCTTCYRLFRLWCEVTVEFRSVEDQKRYENR